MKKFLLVAILVFVTGSANAQTLTASWYSNASLIKEGTYKYSKGVMANGQLFNEDALTAASRDYPLGTRLVVRNEANGKEVRVEVTDRTNKRFKGIRIDLSKMAFSEIADLKQGLVQVIVEEVK